MPLTSINVEEIEQKTIKKFFKFNPDFINPTFANQFLYAFVKNTSF